MKHFPTKTRFSFTASRHAHALAALAVLLAAGTTQAQTPASFAPARTYSAGASSRSMDVAVGDVNGDGRPDLVTANYGNGTVGVLLGQASGGFATVSTYSTGANTFPTKITIADVNGDGRPDLVTANNNNTGTVGVLLGLAGGGFTPVSAYSTGGVYPNSIAVGDVNGDGRPDLVTANNGDNTVGVLLGQASGGFAAGSTYSTGGVYPNSIAVGDVNGDGRLDLVTTYYGNTAGVLLGQASGGFATVSTYFTGANSGPNGSNDGPGSVAVADVNNDGRLDVIAANYYGNTAGVLLGQTGGGLAAVSTYSTGSYSYPQGIGVGDVNGDGWPDLVTANEGNGTAGVLLGRASGGFAAASAYSTGASRGPYSVAAADVNGDGRLDLVTANEGSNTVSVLLNTGTFTPLAAAAATVAAEDVVLFPNPAHGGFAVRLPVAWGAAPVRAELRNALGQVVATRTATLSGGDSLPVATDALAPGVYMLRVQAGGYTLNKRVLLD